MVWDIFISIFTMIVIFFESLKIFFYIEDKKNYITSLYLVNSIILIIYQIDIAKNFITGNFYYNLMIYLLNIKKI